MSARRPLQVTGRALAPVAVFAASYVAVVRTGIATGNPLLGPEIPGVLSTLAVFGWAIADGRRPDAVHRPVRLWALAVAVMSLFLAALFVAFSAAATVALGGELARDGLLLLLGYGALSVVVVAGGATAVAAGGVLIGRSWSRR